MTLTESYAPADTSQPVLETTVGSVLPDAAAQYPDVLALVEGIEDSAVRRTWTYAELLSDAERAARALAQRFEKGERVEELLFTHPKVADVAVCGLPDDKWGESVAAFIRDSVPADPATDAELHDFLRERLSPQKTPRAWYHVDEFPLTASGKIQKFAIVEAWEKGLYDPS